MRRNCRIQKREQKYGNFNKKLDDKNTTTVVFEDVVVLSYGDEECLYVIVYDVKWVFNTTTSYYVTPKREFFISYKVGGFGTMRMGNTSHSKVVGQVLLCYS